MACWVFGLIGVFEEFGGVGAGEEVDGPVGQDVRAVEVVAEFVEVDALPDQGSKKAAELYPEDVYDGAALAEVYELTDGAITEGDGRTVVDLRRDVGGRPLALLFCGLGEGGDR